MRRTLLIGLGLPLVFFLLLGIQKRAEAPSSHPILGAEPISTGALNGISPVNDSMQKNAILSIGQNIFFVELSTTEEERQLGLGGREAIGDDAGMLFVFSQADFHGIWMKGMRFPLDIIWLAPSNFPREKLLGLAPGNSDSRKSSDLPYSLVVVDAKENVIPDTYPTVFFPMKEASYVLELNGGVARKFGVTIGSILTLRK